MSATPVSIHGLVLSDLRQIEDARGAVLHVLRSDSPDFVGFGECYFSEAKPGAVKAWKRHKLQTQMFAVPIGRMKVVLYDDRADSPSRGAVQIIELGRPDAYRRLRIPPLVWYGFASIGSGTALLVNCADRPHDPQESEAVPVDSAFIPYHWQPGVGSK